MNNPYTLWGTPGSLYTAKVRAYLRKHRIDFVERAAGEPEFRERLVPTVGRWIIPVVETPDGDVLQDGTDILDYFAAQSNGRFPIVPDTPVMRVIAHVFELFGGEGLLRPAMHYRWNFDAENIAFIKDDFCAGLAPGVSRAEKDAVFDFASGRMRKATEAFGVSDASVAMVERSYREFLQLLNTHLEGSPYLLGGRPSIGDYALFGPLFAHLGRDPAPASLMKREAPSVYRWTERMNVPEDSSPEHPGASAEFAEAASETLLALLRFVSDDYLPELRAHVAFANSWLADRPDLEAGTNGLEKPGARMIGTASFAWRGVDIASTVMPYRFWLLQRVQDAVEQAGASAQPAITALLSDTGLSDLMSLQTSRPVERRGHLEVWGASR